MKFTHILTIASLVAILPIGIGCNGDDTVADDNKTLSSVEITTGIDTMTVGDTMQFTAMAHYADGSSENITDSRETTWNTSDPENATVDENGMVTAVDEGSVDITATYDGMSAEESFIVLP